jgi:hypothetical protein
VVLSLCEVVRLPEEGVRFDVTRSDGVQIRCQEFLKRHGGLGIGFMGLGRGLPRIPELYPDLLDGGGCRCQVLDGRR